MNPVRRTAGIGFAGALAGGVIISGLLAAPAESATYPPTPPPTSTPPTSPPPTSPPPTSASPTVTPTPPVRPQLPLIVRSNKKAKFTPGEFVPLVKSSRTNQDGVIKRRVLCRPLLTSAAGETSFCRVRVTRNGGVKVKVQGYKRVKVTVQMTARPKKGKATEWRSNRYRESWILRGNTFRKVNAVSSPTSIFGVVGIGA